MRFCSVLLVILTAVSLSGQSSARSGVHPEDMDPTCKPCTDFWRYVNGGWLDKNPIPAHLSSWGTFGVLADANQERTRSILDAAVADQRAAAGSDTRKMADLYSSCMDTAAIDARGVSPLKADFDRIDAIQNLEGLNAVMSPQQRTGRPFGGDNGVVAAPFRLTSGQDPKVPSRVVARIVERDAAGRVGSSIFSLPDRDYYVKDDAKSREIREQFLIHAARELELAGVAADAAAAQAKTILSFETALAGSVMTIAEKRDPDKLYHLMDLAGLRQLAPNVNWILLLRDAGLPESTPINVLEPALVGKVNEMMTSVPLADWKVWLKWRTLDIAAGYLSSPIAAENFHFRGTVLAGTKEQPARWQTCAGIVDRDLTDALGRAWVQKYFPPEAKARMAALVENLRSALRDEITESSWMQASTKKSAIEKLNALQIQIGYPDRWHDYSSLSMDRKKYFENVRAAWTYGQRYEMSKVGKPVDHMDWAMTPPTVNAYSNASEVKVVFPAGILQPPFFDMQADDAANYGGIGVVIGHEMGHQFDDGGSKFDVNGALKNWWTESDRKQFETRTGCVVNQFNTLDVGQGLHHNGKQVLGEALGDLGGISVAYRAWKKASAGKPAVVMDGFTPEQRFFISFARVWGTQYRDEAMRLQLNTNNHPISQYRAIGTLQNMPEFHRAFQCKPGDPMVRPAAEQCKLW